MQNIRRKYNKKTIVRNEVTNKSFPSYPFITSEVNETTNSNHNHKFKIKSFNNYTITLIMNYEYEYKYPNINDAVIE